MLLNLFPSCIHKQNNLEAMAYKGFVHLEMRHVAWGLPQASILDNTHLWRKLAPYSYYKHVKKPGLWYHETLPILFTFIRDNFGVKYVSQEDTVNLIGAIKSTYILTKGGAGKLLWHHT